MKDDGSYAYAIELKAGGRMADAGRWRIAPAKERLSGARIVLENALNPCPGFAGTLDHVDRADRELAPVWEWGRTTLSFDPDLEGFLRQK